MMVLALFCCSLVLFACGARTYYRENNPDTTKPVETMSVADANNDFACDLYGKLRDIESSNFFFSPLSIRTALAMTYAGARGDTASQMASSLKFDPQDADLHAAMGAYIKELNASAKPGTLELSVANALWGQKGFSFRDEFTGLNNSHYGAGLNTVDFVKDTEGARRTINTWIEDKTNDKIKNLIPSGALSSDTRLVLTNAVYFLGTWIEQFQKEATKPAPFKLSAGRTVEVPFMYQREKFMYGEDDSVQVLEMRYKGDRLGMVIVLPKDVEGLEAVESSLSLEKLNELLGGLKRRSVKVYLPRFKIESSFSLKRVLAALGMAKAFSMVDADFSGMTDKGPLFISDVIHKTYVDVNEEGTEAAAATAVMMELAMARPPSEPVLFRADHPFLFMIRDYQSGAILFMGRLLEPK